MFFLLLNGFRRLKIFIVKLNGVLLPVLVLFLQMMLFFSDLLNWIQGQEMESSSAEVR